MAYTTIKKPSDYFNTKLYTGNGGTQSITGVGFQPDWVWVKNRDLGTDAPTIYDAVRGATKRLQTSSTGAESTKTNGLTAFGSDGYTAGSASAINANGRNIVSWNWLASNTSGSSNTDGSITSTVSANTTSGFSIVTYDGTGSAGATVGHGLGVAPSMIIAKKMDGAASNWAVYHKSLGATKYLILNSTAASTTSNTRWNDVEPTSSVFTVGSSGDVNNNGETVVAYCFAEKKGYSKFGSYIGNGSNNGTFVYTGFKPAFIMLKNTVDIGDNWTIYDNKRDIDNPASKLLFAQDSGAEGNGNDMDILSNGFKQRNASNGNNGNGDLFIYMAFAEEPLVGDNPATAR